MNHIECSDCRSEIDPDTCWCGDAMADHCGFSHNHSPVPMGCDCYRALREMLALDLLTQSPAQKIKWWRNWEATFGPLGDPELTALIELQRAFERWIAANYATADFTTDDHGVYTDQGMRFGWDCFKAGRAYIPLAKVA